MEKEGFHKYLLIAFIVLTVYISFLIIKKFIPALLIAAFLAYLGNPLYKKLNLTIKYKYNKGISATLITILIIFIFLLPTAFIANTISSETINLIKTGNITDKINTFTSSHFKNEPTISVIIADSMTKAIAYVKNATINFILSLPSRIISLFITIIALFYFLIIGEPLVNQIRKSLPIKKRSELVQHIREVTNAIVYGLFLTAILQFIIALVGFKILNTQSPFLFALIIGIAAFIPFIGPAIIWVPLAILSFVEGNFTKVIGLLLLGLILSVIEHFIKAKVAQIKANVHPLIVIIGALGGIEIFGFVGFIVGPIILSSLIIILREYFDLGEENEA